MTTRAMRALAPLLLLVACGDPHVLNGFRSPMGVRGVRWKSHSGVDFRGELGDPVLAAAPGHVVSVIEEGAAGIAVMLGHGEMTGWMHAMYTTYLHLSSVTVEEGEQIARGEQLGTVGATGWASGGVPHLHLHACSVPCMTGTADGDFEGVLDPMANNAGCFDPERDYDELTLTYPIRC